MKLEVSLNIHLVSSIKCFAQETNTKFLRLWANKIHNGALFAAMWFSNYALFYIWHLQWPHDHEVTPELTFFFLSLDNAWSHLNGHVKTQSNRYWIAENHFISHCDVKVCCAMSCVFCVQTINYDRCWADTAAIFEATNIWRKTLYSCKGFLQLCISENSI